MRPIKVEVEGERKRRGKEWQGKVRVGLRFFSESSQILLADRVSRGGKDSCGEEVRRR